MIAIVYCISFVSSLLTTSKRVPLHVDTGTDFPRLHFKVLIVHRLWKVEKNLQRQASRGLTSSNTPENLRNSQHQSRSRLGQVMVLVIESGIMFTTTEFFCMLAFALQSNMAYIATYTVGIIHHSTSKFCTELLQ